MLQWFIRGAMLLWAAFFAIVGVQGLLDPTHYDAMFGIVAEGPAANTVRADLSAFFLVAAGGAAGAAAVPRWIDMALVPAALYATAFVGRVFGLLVGDPVTPAIVQAMIVEALSVALMLGGWRFFKASTPRPQGDPEDGNHI